MTNDIYSAPPQRPYSLLALAAIALFLLVAFALLPFLWLGKQFEAWIELADFRKLDRRATHLGGVLLVAVATLLALQLLEAAFAGRFSF